MVHCLNFIISAILELSLKYHSLAIQIFTIKWWRTSVNIEPICSWNAVCV